ncbi:GTPase ObgE [Bacteriovoracaceae bacterium]|nr:GTPase ObgE [Bacteriovoracaceae bacterium]
MKFIDEVEIKIRSGNGGNGCTSFRREKFVPMGGPDGGDGGKGGSVQFLTDRNINTLSKFRGKKNYFAQNGESGTGRQRSGKDGDDYIIKVPVGTLIKDTESDQLLCDLTTEGENYTMLIGGRGGLGNINFKSSTNQAPQYSQEGEEGEELDVKLELKLLADIGLIGLPNAGKSTLISALSNSRPKIADYPFTTLEPNLGVCDVQGESVVLADIPGLIEGASEGKGLGIKFLKHIERTSSFVHLIDISMLLEPFEALEHYVTIRRELENYDTALIQDKKELICLSKIDALSDEEIDKFKNFLEKELDKKVLPISSVSHKNMEKLKHLLIKAKSL